jgi:hypothetical protein
VDFGHHEVICDKRPRAVDVARQDHRVQTLREFDVLVRNARSPRRLGHGFEGNVLSQTLELAH